MPAAWGVAALGVVALGVAGWAVRSGPDSDRPAAAPQPTASAPVAASPVTRISPAEARTGADETKPSAADVRGGAGGPPAGAADAQASLPTTTDVGSRPRLGEILDDASLRGDRQSAFTALYARWGVTYDGRTGACDRARPDGIECLFRTATWTRLRRLGLPAIIELTTRTGTKRYATLTALGPRTATLQFGDRTFAFALDEIEPFWNGESIALWKPPSAGTVSIGPGGRGKDIEWLRQRLAAIDGRPLPTTHADLYDDPLRERVRAFQRSRALVPDGIAGAETLTHLSTALRDSTIPVLASPRP
jgi:general secretion pathway protein A